MAAAVLVVCSAAHAKSDAECAPTPDTAQFQKVVTEAHAKFKDVKEGKNADYIPILKTIPSELFGVVIATHDGTMYGAGDVDYRFAIESVSKPFTAALVMQQYGGPQVIPQKIGVEPTGLPFNSKMALELYKDRSVNPLVNAGAIAAVSLVKANSENDRWERVLTNLRDFAGGAELPLMDEVFSPSTRPRGAIGASPTCSSTTGDYTPTLKKRCESTRSNVPSASAPRNWR